jgi:hypothetical protein
MVLCSTQPLTERVLGLLSGDEGGQVIGLITLPPSCADCPEIWEPELLGTLMSRPVQVLLYL